VSTSDRRSAVDDFYRTLDRLHDRCGDYRYLSQCTSKSGWPLRGVYFFFENGEVRTDGVRSRAVRVGTHALTVASKTTLWKRLSQHRGRVGGQNPGGGNHRESIFRLHVGSALIARDGWTVPTWGVGNNAPREVKEGEFELERAVSEYIGAMPFLWVDVPNQADDRMSDRGYVERNAIALLSNVGQEPIDRPSENWLGRWSNREAVRASGLWNVNHVNEHADPAFLTRLVDFVR
jgi:hypothetical protein